LRLGRLFVELGKLLPDEFQPIFQHAQHTLQVVTALHDQTTGGNHAVSALLARQSRVFFNPVKRVFTRSAINGENRRVAQQIDGVIAPCASGDLASVKIKDGGQLVSVKGNAASLLPVGRIESDGLARATRAKIYRVGCLAQIESSVSADANSRIALTRNESKGDEPPRTFVAVATYGLGTEIPRAGQISDPPRATICLIGTR